MRADSRFGGHFVQGHIDGTSTVETLRRDGESRWIRIGVPPALAPYMVRKGSIAIDGISLTIAELADRCPDGAPGWFEVMIIPFTWTHTHLPSLAPGDRVNLECDMVGKYVARAVDAYSAVGLVRRETQGSTT
jgi:riboflavin synthase